GAIAHVDPDQAGTLDGAVGLGLDFLLEALVLGHVRHVEAVAGDVELPAVIDAAQPALLVAAEEQRGATVRAAMVDHADAALAVAEGHKLLAQQHQADRRAVAAYLPRPHRRDPLRAPHTA